MPQVAKAAVGAGIGWGIINSESDYIAELGKGARFCLLSQHRQFEVGRIQGTQLGVLVPQGMSLCRGTLCQHGDATADKGKLFHQAVGVD